MRNVATKFGSMFNFEDWLNSLKDKKLPTEDHERTNLILYLNHVALQGVHPFYWYDWPSLKWTGDKSSVEYMVTTFGFSPVRNEKSKPGWSHLLNKPGFNRRVVVSVGFDNGQEIPSQLTPDQTPNPKPLQELQKQRAKISPSDKDKLKENERQQEVERARLEDQQFYLTIIPKLPSA
jgi:hypothetical protein